MHRRRGRDCFDALQRFRVCCCGRGDPVAFCPMAAKPFGTALALAVRRVIGILTPTLPLSLQDH